MSPTFAQLGVPAAIADALAQRGITEPFEIQTATLVDALAGRDVCGRAPTGSGKTVAFGIPMVAGIEKAQARMPKGLILSPTRELAEQISTELRSFAGRTRIGVVYGGVGYGAQIRSLQQGVEVLVACPGRLEDLIERGDVDLRAVNRVVLDEADRMADMGFMPAVRRILDQTSKKRQTLLFSATLDGDVAKLTREYQKDPVRHEVGEETPDITLASHLFWTTSQAERTAVTAAAALAEWPAIIFCRTRHGCDRLTKQLIRQGVHAAAIHGGRNQNQRTRALADFTSSRVQALVATDVAARGIHVDGVTLVVHYDPPEDHKTYVHRSGRTARAGKGGVVISLVQPAQERDARKVQRQIGLDEPFTDPDIEALRALSSNPVPAKVRPAARPEPSEDRRPRSSNGKRDGHRRSRGGSGQRSHSSRSDERSDSNNRSRARHGASSDGDAPASTGSRRKNSNSRSAGGQRAGAATSGSGTGNGKSGQRQGAAKSGGRSSGPKRSGSGSSSNRKARRAHMQPGSKR